MNVRDKDELSIFGIVILIIIGLTFVGAVVYGGWNLYRWFNWEYGYSDFVKRTVNEMVRGECLK